MHCRCRKCEGRRTLDRHPDHYIRTPQCRTPGCRSRTWRVDRYREQYEVAPGAPRPCRCGEYAGRDGNPMPHRRGSGWCIHNDKVSIDDRQQRWETGAHATCR